MRIQHPLRLVFFVLVSLAAGFVGTAFMGDSVSTWYTQLIQPSWTPPSWVFAPVWTILYVCMGTAAYLVSCSPKRGKVFVLWLFLAHLLVNAFWSIAFFTLREIALSVLVIVVLLSVIILLAALFSRYSKAAMYLMLPYVLWVLYATTLAIGILVLN